jgi:spermidine synthase
LKFYKDGPANSVAVVASPKSPSFNEEALSIVVNGKSDSSTISDIYTLKLSAHLPALLAPSREEVLVIGLGTGTTAGEVSLYPDVKRIDIAEISPTVVEALSYFQGATHDIHKDPRAKIHIADAFRVLRGSDQRWDIIISEPSNPWVSGVDQLYTQEFYELAREHMSGEGVLLQWIHTYDSSEAMVGMVANTIVREFPHTSVFMASDDDIFFVASVKPLTGENVKRAEQIMAGNSDVRESLGKINIKSVDEILIRQIWSPSFIRNSFSGFGIQPWTTPGCTTWRAGNFSRAPA